MCYCYYCENKYRFSHSKRFDLNRLSDDFNVFRGRGIIVKITVNVSCSSIWSRLLANTKKNNEKGLIFCASGLKAARREKHKKAKGKRIKAKG